MQRIAMALQQPVDSLAVAAPGVLQQLAGFILIGPHGYSVPSNGGRFDDDSGCSMLDARCWMLDI
jgi:hypothetical protein